MRIDRHIFGSYSGYTTVARSAGITAEDARSLESGAYSFGQSHDRAYLKSLARHPAYFTRLIPGGRRGLTRVFEGDADDNNRPTLRLVTLVVSQRDWDTLLCGDISLLLDERSLWEWDGAPALAAVEYTPAAPSRSLPRKNVEKMLALVSEAERALAAHRMLVVSADDYALPELRALEMLIPPSARRQFTSACRALSPQLPVNVNALAAEAGSQGRATFRYAAGGYQLSPYASFLSATELSAGTIPVEAIANYRQFGASEAISATSPAGVAPARNTVSAPPLVRPHRGSPWPVVLALLVGVLLSAVAYFAGKSFGAAGILAAERARQEVQRQDHEQAILAAVAEQAASDRERLKKKMEVTGDSYDDVLTAAASKLQDAHNAATTAAHDSSGDRDRFKSERDQIKSAYEGEMARQRERFEALRKQAATAFAVKNIRKMEETAQTLARIDGELNALAEQWPAAGAENGKWLSELKAVRQRVQSALAIASILGRISNLLDECEDTVGSAAGAAAVNVKANLEEAMDLSGQLPAKSESGGPDIGALRIASLERAKKVREWLIDQEKAGHKPQGSPDAQASGNRSEASKWWDNLPPKQREEIRKHFLERAAAAAKKNGQNGQQSGGDRRDHSPDGPGPDGQRSGGRPNDPGSETQNPSPRSNNR